MKTERFYMAAPGNVSNVPKPGRRRFRYWQGVRYVAPWKPAPDDFVRCLSCGRAWDGNKPTSYTPTPAARCPFEHWHKEVEA